LDNTLEGKVEKSIKKSAFKYNKEFLNSPTELSRKVRVIDSSAEPMFMKCIRKGIGKRIITTSRFRSPDP
jgi:hypothetical protein